MVTDIQTRDVRQRADWMTLTDDKLLEAIESYGNLRPSSAENLDICTRYHASRRMGYLVDAGLLERVADTTGLYGLTDRGRAYLRGEFDGSQLADPTPDEDSDDDDESDDGPADGDADDNNSA